MRNYIWIVLVLAMVGIGYAEERETVVVPTTFGDGTVSKQEYLDTVAKNFANDKEKFESIKANSQMVMEGDRIVYITPDGNHHSFLGSQDQTVTADAFMASRQEGADWIVGKIQATPESQVVDKEVYEAMTTMKEHKEAMAQIKARREAKSKEAVK